MKRQERKSSTKGKCETFPVLERKGGPSAWRMGESRICYVGTKESLLMYSV